VRALLVCCALAAGARAATHDFAVVDVTLPNGVRVVLSPLRGAATTILACGAEPVDDLARAAECLRGRPDPLVVAVGDFDPAEVRARAEAECGKLPQARHGEWRPAARERYLGRASDHESIEVAYQVAVAQPADGYALLLARALLQERLAAQAVVSVGFGPQHARLAVLAPALAERERIESELERLRREPVSAVELARARAALQPAERADWRAERLRDFTLAFGNPRLVRDFSDGLAAITPADLQRACARLLQRAQRSITEARRLPAAEGAPKVP
jgi:predicted Zn-dependent peptidase